MASVNKLRTVLVVCCVAQLMVNLDSSMLSIALSDLRSNLGLTPDSLPWTVNAYAIPLASLLLFGGRLSDRYGPRRVLLVGVVIFAGASLIAGTAFSAGMLFTGRALQGAGAALMSTSCLALLSRSFPSGTSRAKAFGMWAAAAGSGGAVGVLAGGVIVDFVGWRWTLLINLPIATGLCLLLSLVPNPKVTARPQLDLPGTAAFSIAAISAVLAIASFSRPIAGIPASPWIFTGTSAAGLFAFVFVERRSPGPLIPRAAHTSRALWVLAGSMFLVGGAMTSVFYFAALNFQIFHGLSPFIAGLGFLPLSLGAFVAASLSPLLQARIGVEVAACAGATVMSIGLVAVWTSAPMATTFWLIAFSGVFGLGMGLLLSSISNAATGALPPTLVGAASGLLTTAQQMGNSIGLAAATVVDNLSPNVTHTAGFGAATSYSVISVIPLLYFALNASKGYSQSVRGRP
ncbi:MAG: MFS transporter [Brevibacterium sp.]